MVRLASVVVFALASALSAVHAHDVATHGVGDAVERRAFKLAARQSMAKCANSDKLRQLHARTQTNRHDQWQQLRAERQQAAEKVMATNHKASLKGVKSPADVDVATLFATKPVAHVLEPDVTEGPFYVKGELVRNDVREDQQGIDLYTELQIIDVNTCEPVVGLYLDFWHCNSTGVYSGVVSEINGVPSDLTNVNTTFARGLAPTNNDGVVQFVSKFPGHYAMRTTHIHILGNHGGKLLENNTFVGSAVSNIGQIFFDQDLITEVEKTGVYKTNTQPMTTNAEDGIFLEEASTGFDPIVKYTLLGDTVEDGIFAWISIGVDLKHTAKVYNAATWTDKGGVMNPAPFAFGDMPFVKFDAASSNANDTVVVTPATPTETVAPAPAKSVHPLFALIFVALVLIVSNQVDTDATSTIATTGALVSVYTLIYGAPLNDAIALAVVTTTGSGIAVFMDNIRLSAKEPSGKSLIDWDLLLVLQPSLLIGVLIGVFTRTIVPEWFLSTVIATLLLICGSLLLQASHRRQDETSIGWSINEESSLIVEKPQTVETTPSFGDAFQKVPSDKLGVLVGVLGAVIILQVALYVAVPLVLLCYLGYKSYKTTVDTFERQQLPRVNPEDGEIKWSWHVVHTLPIASTLGGTLFGALGFGCDMVICPFVVEAGLGQKIAGATGPSIVLVAGLMAALECLASGHVNNTLIFFIILLAFAVKSWGKQVVDRFVPEYLRRASIVLLAFAILTLVGGIGLAVEVA